MEALFTPHLGLVVWTVITFLLMVFILGRFGWKPLLKGLEAREKFLREERAATEQARAAAENLKREHEAQLAKTQETIHAMIEKAKVDVEANRNRIIEEAKQESDRIVERGRKDLSGEMDRLKMELRAEVGSLAVTVAEKVLEKTMDAKAQEQFIKAAVKELTEVQR